MRAVIADLSIVNYCHPSCEPLKNIMRLPREQAFALARELAEQNPETTAFYRFADFANYYPQRMKTDALLRARFMELGGRPTEEHPLSFVLQGSSFLDNWFGNGIVTRIPLCQVPAGSVSFTYGDSMTMLEKHGDFRLVTKDMLLAEIVASGSVEAFLAQIAEQYRYIEVQLWDDACLHKGAASR